MAASLCKAIVAVAVSGNSVQMWHAQEVIRRNWGRFASQLLMTVAITEPKFKVVRVYWLLHACLHKSQLGTMQNV